MKIKTKLRLGFGFLFVVIIFFGSVSLYYMSKISASSKVILKDNYESLKYTRAMRTILDENKHPLSLNSINRFSKVLALEKSNVTEPGEAQAVSVLASSFSMLKASGADLATQQEALRKVHEQVGVLDDLNMGAILKKNDAAQRSIEQAAAYLVFMASICFLILFSFSLNFPDFVANPLRDFSEAIKAIGRKNYKQHIEFKGNDEFSALANEFNIMAAQLNKWENSNLAQLQSEKLRIEAIIGQMQDAIIGLDEKKTILFLNPIAGRLLNIHEKDVVGKNVLTLLKTNDLLRSVISSGTDSELMKIYADGKQSYFKLERREIMVPVYENRSEKVVTHSLKAAGEVYILKNVTEYKELDEAKTNFIATVSHELKTPISSIKMSIKLLSDERVGQMNDEQKQLVQHIKEDCGRLLKITGELLDLSQVETGQLQLNFVKSDPKKVAMYAMETVRFQAEQKEIELELISRNNLPSLNIDVEKTAWVLVNFLSNALRYGPKNSRVVIQITESSNNIEFSVRDFGKGIDEQYQKRLFDRYFQVPTDGNNKSGSGLGLAISKDFIEAQGGTIWVESEIGTGSRFCFQLPKAD